MDNKEKRAALTPPKDARSLGAEARTVLDIEEEAPETLKPAAAFALDVLREIAARPKAKR